MLLSRTEILSAVADGRLIIEPFSPDQVGAASVDLTLGEEIRVFTRQVEPLPITEAANYQEVTRVVTIKDQFILPPQETILGMTREKITLAPTLAGRLEGRSRFARAGLLVHISSGFVQPGVANRQVLEISNLSPTPLALKPGTRVCQLIIEEVKGTAVYDGMFKRQVRI